MAVYSKNRDVDPVGACVGPKGARVQAIVTELNGEKVDIVKWDEEHEVFVGNALSPAKVVSVRLQADQKIAGVVVPDYQLSLAIGKEGQNARLAAKLTGWKIDITSESQAVERGILPVEMRSQLLGNNEDIMNPHSTVPGVPGEMIEAAFHPDKGDEENETP